MIIYKITNLINGKCYVGQTVCALKRRMNRHFSGREKSAISYAIQKYGAPNFKYEVIDTATTREDLNNLEKKYITTMNSLSPFGYNIRTGGGCGHACSAELRNKISTNTKAAMQCPAIREKISSALKGRDNSKNSGTFVAGHQMHNMPIQCVETGEVFENQLAAAKALGVSKSAISAHIKGKTATCKKLTFRKVA